MDINILLNSCTVAIAQNSVLETWCQANYGRFVSVYANFDERNPPGEDRCPAVCVYPAAKEYGGKIYDDALEFIVMLHDDTVRVHAGIANITEYTGVQNIETFRQRVLAAIAAVIEATAATRIDSVSVEYETIAHFPFILAVCAIAVQTPYTIGSGSPFLSE